MPTRTFPYFTAEQYLTFDRSSEFKNEYIFGDIVCMAGGTPRHALIMTNAAGELRNRLSGGCCRVYSSDLRVSLNPKTGYVYPDVTVVCGELEYVDKQKDTIANPKLVVEVLSPTTLDHDLGVKARLYWEAPSLSDLLFIEQDKVGIEHWYRASDGEWKRTVLRALDAVLDIRSLNCQIPVAQLYLGVELPSAGE